MVVLVVMTGFNGADEAGSRFPCLAHLTPAEGVTVNLRTRHHCYFGLKAKNKDVHIMKITQQFVIAWICSAWR